ncbi:hypothetical protein T484DRAFT_1841878 [Baffinella frigidus]|nr:hypothetical protein T484DRAFT_1841878 [Cryptophyta sp. CCMP2293]
MKISEEESVTLPPYSARQMRLLFMMHQWDQPMYFSKGTLDVAVGKEKTFKGFLSIDTLDVAVGKEKTFKDFFGMVKALARDDLESVANKVQAWGPDDVALNKRVEETQIAITAALTDNFNTPMALLKMQELVSAVNVYITAAGPDAKFLLINKAACYIGKIFKTLGIDDDCSAFPFVTSQGGGDDEEVLGATLDALCAFRDEVRKGARGKETPEWFTAKAAECRAGTLADLDAKVAGKVSALPQVLGAMRQWVDSVSAAAEAKEGAVMYLKLCDKVRDDVLPALGVRLEDRTDGSFLWKLDDAEVLPKVLLRERAEQIQVASEAAKKKVENKLAMKVKDLDKWKSSTQTPAEMFKAMADKYSKFDDAGVPTHTAAGEELSKKQRQTAEKDFKKKEAEYTKQQEQLAATPGLVAGIEKEIEDLRKLMAEL